MATMPLQSELLVDAAGAPWHVAELLEDPSIDAQLARRRVGVGVLRSPEIGTSVASCRVGASRALALLLGAAVGVELALDVLVVLHEVGVRAPGQSLDCGDVVEVPALLEDHPVDCADADRLPGVDPGDDVLARARVNP